MIRHIAAFEARQIVAAPAFPALLLLFLALAFGLAASGVSIGGGGPIGGSTIAAGVLIGQFSYFYLLLVLAFAAPALQRDRATGFAPVLYATPVPPAALALGRLGGVIGMLAAGFLVVPLGLFAGAAWRAGGVLQGQLTAALMPAMIMVALPNILLAATVICAVAALGRSTLAALAAVAGFYVLYAASSAPWALESERLAWVSVLEPFGVAALRSLLRHASAAELANTGLPVDGPFLLNRLSALALAAFAAGVLAARFRPNGAEAARCRTRARGPRAERPRPAASPGPTRAAARLRASAGASFAARLRLELSQLCGSITLLVLAALAIGMALALVAGAGAVYGTPAYPLTSLVVHELQVGSTTFLILIAAALGGEIVWRDRECGVAALIDATPVANGALVLAKVAALFTMLLILNLVIAATGLAWQAAASFSPLRPDLLLLWFVLPQTLDMALLAVLGVVIQVASPNKYVGWGGMLAWCVLSFLAYQYGLEHRLLSYGHAGAVPLSDMAGVDRFWVGAAWSRLYWMAIAGILLVGAHLLWRRGQRTPLRTRMAQAPRRLTRRVAALLALLGATAVAAGARVYHDTDVLNDFRPPAERQRYLAEYEQRYLPFAKELRPVVTDVRVAISLVPAERRLDARGTLRLVNRTGRALRLVHVRRLDRDTELRTLAIPGASRVHWSPRFGYAVFRLAAPLVPGGAAELHFATRVWRRGFPHGDPRADLVANGSFVDSNLFVPVIGMDARDLLTDPAVRRRFDLPAALPAGGASDVNYLRADWATTRIAVSTDADQTPVAPGTKMGETVAGGRRHALFVSRTPILNYFSVQSARYVVARRRHGDVDLAVYHHPGHDWNVARMLDTSAQALDYYSRAFGPYQFDQLRIVEFPRYLPLAQAFANTIPFSEGAGFAADLRDPAMVDYVAYVTAHELAHQWWAHQLVGADRPGAALLTETLAQYSALMVMKRRFGEPAMRRFLLGELDAYLSHRHRGAGIEPPMARLGDQPHLYYAKGSLVMYRLQAELGEAAVNRALRRLLKEFRFAGSLYPTSDDLIEALETEADTPAQHALIDELFRTVSVTDAVIVSARTRKRPDGRWETVARVAQDSMATDGNGRERRVMSPGSLLVALFDGDPDKAGRRFAIKHTHIASGSGTIMFVTGQAPSHVAADPDALLIDRAPGNNVRRVDRT